MARLRDRPKLNGPLTLHDVYVFVEPVQVQQTRDVERDREHLVAAIGGGGDATALTLLTSPSGAFSFTGTGYPGSGGNCANTISANSTCTVEIQFHPTTTGNYSSSFSMSSISCPARSDSSKATTAAELRNVALDYVLLKDLPDAERWMSRSLAMDGNDAETWYAMGRLHYTQGRYSDALTCFEKTLALNPRICSPALSVTDTSIVML